MIVTTEIDTKVGVVVNTLTGPGSRSQFEDAFEGMLGNAEFESGMGVVWDVRDGAIDALSSSDVVRLVDFAASRLQMRGLGRLAMLVTRNISYGVARMIDGYSSEIPVEREIFRDFDEAVRWASGAPLEQR